MDAELGWDPNPKRIPPDAKSFMANGREYFKAESVSNQRYLWLQELQVELGYGQTIEDFFAEQRKQYELVNQQKFADAAVSLHNSMNGIRNIADRKPTVAMRIMALFWNYKGEAVGVMTNELMEEKVADWEAEGIDIRDFFREALSVVPGLLSAYAATNSSSKEAPQTA